MRRVRIPHGTQCSKPHFCRLPTAPEIQKDVRQEMSERLIQEPSYSTLRSPMKGPTRSHAQSPLFQCRAPFRLSVLPPDYRCASVQGTSSKEPCARAELVCAYFPTFVSWVDSYPKNILEILLPSEVGSPKMFPSSDDSSFNQHFPLAAYYRYTQCFQSHWISGLDNTLGGEHRVVLADVCRIFSCLFDGFHFLFAPGVIEGADNDGLAECDVPR